MMPFVLVLIGVVIAITAYNGTGSQLWQLLVGDFTGAHSFLWWLVSIFAVGAIGYIPALKTLANSLLILIVLAIVLSNKGFFSQFQGALASGDANAAPVAQDASFITNGSGGGNIETAASVAALFT